MTVALMLAGLYVGQAAFALGLWESGAPGPGLFPFVSASVLTGLMAVELLRGRRTARTVISARVDGDWLGRRFQGYLWGLTGYVVGLPILGFALSSAIAFVAMMRFAEGVSWTRTLLILAAAIAMAEIVLRRLLGVPLPLGPFGPLS